MRELLLNSIERLHPPQGPSPQTIFNKIEHNPPNICKISKNTVTLKPSTKIPTLVDKPYLQGPHLQWPFLHTGHSQRGEKQPATRVGPPQIRVTLRTTESPYIIMAAHNQKIFSAPSVQSTETSPWAETLPPIIWVASSLMSSFCSKRLIGLAP